jgi:hypothetical protein
MSAILGTAVFPTPTPKPAIVETAASPKEVLDWMLKATGSAACWPANKEAMATIAGCCGSAVVKPDGKWYIAGSYPGDPIYGIDENVNGVTKKDVSNGRCPYFIRDTARVCLAVGWNAESFLARMYPEKLPHVRTIPVDLVKTYEILDKDLGPCTISWVDQ